MEEKVKVRLESRLCAPIRKEWNDKKKRLVTARIAKAVVDECWLYVGASSPFRCVVTVFPSDGEAIACVDLNGTTDAWSVAVPVDVVCSFLSHVIPVVGCDPDEVAKALAIRMWRAYQKDNCHASVVKTPRSLFDYCHETIPTNRASLR